MFPTGRRIVRFGPEVGDPGDQSVCRPRRTRSASDDSSSSVQRNSTLPCRPSPIVTWGSRCQSTGNSAVEADVVVTFLGTARASGESSRRRRGAAALRNSPSHVPRALRRTQRRLPTSAPASTPLGGPAWVLAHRRMSSAYRGAQRAGTRSHIDVVSGARTNVIVLGRCLTRLYRPTRQPAPTEAKG